LLLPVYFISISQSINQKFKWTNAKALQSHCTSILEHEEILHAGKWQCICDKVGLYDEANTLPSPFHNFWICHFSLWSANGQWKCWTVWDTNPENQTIVHYCCGVRYGCICQAKLCANVLRNFFRNKLRAAEEFWVELNWCDCVPSVLICGCVLLACFVLFACCCNIQFCVR